MFDSSLKFVEVLLFLVHGFDGCLVKLCVMNMQSLFLSLAMVCPQHDHMLFGFARFVCKEVIDLVMCILIYVTLDVDKTSKQYMSL